MHEDEDALTPGERELESALAHLTPAPPLDRRESIAYAAGYRAARRQAGLWRTTSAALAASLVLALVLRPQPQAEIQYVTAPEPPTLRTPDVLLAYADPAPLPPNTYLAFRDDVLDHGLDALPSTRSGSSAGSQATPRAGNIQPIPLSTLLGGRL